MALFRVHAGQFCSFNVETSMFANFLYFIIALLILTLYQAPAELPFSASQALLMFLLLSVLFGVFLRRQYAGLIKKIHERDMAFLDHRYTLLVTRHSILSLFLFAVDIWALHLPAYLETHPWFKLLPTLGALLFLLVFVVYLTMVWFFSYDAHREIYRSDISRKTFVYSNAAFSVPILIPWALLFGISDVIGLLPWELPKRLLDTAYGQIGYFLFFLLIAACFAPLLIHRFWRCRPLEQGAHRQRIEALCRRAGVSYADIIYWPIFGGRMITAAVMGLVGRFRYILVTKALLSMLNTDEIDQVIAHEIGHVKRKHLLLYLLFLIGFMLVSSAIYPLSYYLFFFSNPLLSTMLAIDLDPYQWVNIIYGGLLIVSVVLYFRFIFGYFMRNFERQADLYVFSLFPSVQPLISTFGKIVHTSGQPADKPNWHHFSIQQRVDYLDRSESDPRWITHHDKKVRNSILLFLFGLIAGAVAVYQLNQFVFSQDNDQINMAIIKQYIERKAGKSPQDAPYYFLLGDFYMEAKDYKKAIDRYVQGLELNPQFELKSNILSRIGGAYFELNDHQKAADAWSQALALAPDDSENLNNLAWLMATTGDKSLYDPVKALELARKALEGKSSPHILDTYAQALFINGQIEAAIKAERQALALNPKDRRIYEDQLNKFLKALDR